MLPWAHPSQLTKRYHCQFSRFPGLTVVTGNDAPSVAVGRI